ncbi:flagellar export protein FliJ [bacterium]|nr:flagellar export protein FliJ [bacterium]
MKRFRFRLQRVMDAKLSEERLRQRELGDAQGLLLEEERKLRTLIDQLADEEVQQRQRIQGSMRAGDAVLHNSWYRELRTRIRTQNLEVDKAAKLVEEARERLTEVSKEKRVLERLKERRQEEHRQATLSETQNMLDDIGTRKQTLEKGHRG